MRRWLWLAVLTVAAAGAALGAGQKFYRDDPLWRDPESQDATAVRTVDLSQQYDFVENTFLNAGDRTDKRAVNINTVDEVPTRGRAPPPAPGRSLPRNPRASRPA